MYINIYLIYDSRNYQVRIDSVCCLTWGSDGSTIVEIIKSV